jgi:hypothetical protein
MDERPFYKSSYNWYTAVVIFIISCALLNLLSVINDVLAIVSIVLDFILILVIFLKKFLFYDDRVEIVRLNKYLKKRKYKYDDLLKVEYRDGVVRSPAVVILFTKDEPNSVKKSFIVSSKKKTKELLKRLFDRGVKISFNCPEEDIPKLKSW